MNKPGLGAAESSECQEGWLVTTTGFRCCGPRPTAQVLNPITVPCAFAVDLPCDRSVQSHWASRQEIEGPSHGSFPLAEDDLVASAKDFHFLAVQTKLLRQPDSLAVSRAEYARGSRAVPSESGLLAIRRFIANNRQFTNGRSRACHRWP